MTFRLSGSVPSRVGVIHLPHWNRPPTPDTTLTSSRLAPQLGRGNNRTPVVAAHCRGLSLPPPITTSWKWSRHSSPELGLRASAVGGTTAGALLCLHANVSSNLHASVTEGRCRGPNVST